MTRRRERGARLEGVERSGGGERGEGECGVDDVSVGGGTWWRRDGSGGNGGGAGGEEVAMTGRCGDTDDPECAIERECRVSRVAR